MPIGPILKGAGQFTKRVTLQSPTTVVDPMGGTSQSFTSYATVWAAVDPQPFIVGSEKAEVLTLVTVRYRDDILPRHRVVSEGTTYEILAIIDPQQEHRQLTLHCAEVD